MCWNIKEGCAEVTVSQHHGYRTGQNWHNHYQQEGGNEPGPYEQWHLHVSHARGTHVNHGNDDVDGTHDGRNTHHVHTKNEEVSTWWSVSCRQWCVEGPAEVGRTTFHEQGSKQQGKCKRQNPEAHVVHARQCHIRRANHQWDHPVGESHGGRHHGTKHHDQTMHGSHLVEEVWLNQLHARHEQFGADDHGHRTTYQKHHKGENQVHGTDVLVIGGEYPPLYASRRMMMIMVVVAMRCIVNNCSHVLFPSIILC